MSPISAETFATPCPIGQVNHRFPTLRLWTSTRPAVDQNSPVTSSRISPRAPGRFGDWLRDTNHSPRVIAAGSKCPTGASW